jgi:hypothetical protein
MKRIAIHYWSALSIALIRGANRNPNEQRFWGVVAFKAGE